VPARRKSEANSQAAAWFEGATSAWADWSPVALGEAKGGQTISVVIPARNEAATIGGIVAGLRRSLAGSVRLVDEIVVMDSDSSDGTSTAAADAGATVHRVRDVRPDLGGRPGKGEALWKSQFVTSGDVLVFIDADLTGWGPHFVSGLLGPLLTDAGVCLVKGFYDRVLDDGSGLQAPQGGRVTELVARPLLNLYWPELARVVQPLAGEWAIRRSAFAALEVPTGYGVEMATLLDIAARYGLEAVAQVDLGERAHSHQSVHDLGVMAAEIIAVAGRRAGSRSPAAEELWQFNRSGHGLWSTRPVPTDERPPANSVRDLPC
jgi:glucosyl-3-phosphoglycerate synthase